MDFAHALMLLVLLNPLENRWTLYHNNLTAQNEKQELTNDYQHVFFIKYYVHIPSTCKEEKSDEAEPCKLILCRIQ
jgi:hypothetical protein